MKMEEMMQAAMRKRMLTITSTSFLASVEVTLHSRCLQNLRSNRIDLLAAEVGRCPTFWLVIIINCCIMRREREGRALARELRGQT
jgi:hypothetical protein